MSLWAFGYEGYDPAQEGLREALCTLGNGYFATRGAAEECSADGVHYPGTYLAGGYNRARTQIAGEVIENEDVVNLPNWLSLSFCPEGGDWFAPDTVEFFAYEQALDLRAGLLRRRLRFRDAGGRETSLTTRRLVHMEQAHLAAIEWELQPENWSGRITLRSALDGRVVNAGVPRYHRLAGDHLVPVMSDTLGDDGMSLVVETRQSHLRVAQAVRTRLFRAGAPVSAERRTCQQTNYVAQDLVVEVRAGEPLMVEKLVSLYTSRDRAISEPVLAAADAVAGGERFSELAGGHAQAWTHLWDRCDIVLEGDDRAQRILRLHVFHLLQTLSPHTADLDVGVPARGLHGEAYRGHVFWDELFVLPFLNTCLPEVTAALLRYRYRRLGAARSLARRAGFAGAMHPWQSGSDGREESQVLHLNPQSGRWVPDNTHLQRHVSAAVGYNVWRYYQVTDDREFLSLYGAEMLIEIARFWASLARWNPARERYDICGVMGPDEFHDAYPERDEPGVDNNAYTNVLVAWLLQRALTALDRVGPNRRRELSETLGLDERERVIWDEISRNLFVPFHDGLPSQFEGYERLAEFDWAGYRARYGDIHRLDRLLEAEGDSPNRYKASKQADVLMLFYLFARAELEEIFDQLGYELPDEMIERTVDYYLQRTAHGSTLSHVVHSWALARRDRGRSWALFKKALESDVADVQGGTTPEGIHLGAMVGTLDLVQRAQTGLDMHDGLRLDPCLPQELQGLGLRLRYKGHWLDLGIRCNRMTLSAPDGWAGPDRVVVRDRSYAFGAGQRLEFECHSERGGSRPMTR